MKLPSSLANKIKQENKLVGIIKNKWRRTVELYEIPNCDTQLFMIGYPFEGGELVVTREDIGMNERIARDYWAHGHKVYVRD